MKIEDVLSEPDISKKVEKLKKGRLTELPAIDKFKKQWNPSEHEIFNAVDRPDKTVYTEQVDENGDGTGKMSSRIEKVARIALALQRLIVKRAASFLFGNPVKVISSIPESKVAFAVDKILAQNKQKGLNKRIARILFASTEVAEYWYPVESKVESKRYGFPTKFKLKCAIFSPLKGDVLYPFFDETGDMVSFSREYTVKEDGTDVKHFETWTDEKYFRYKLVSGGWADALEGNIVKIQLGKIPIVYASQESTEWEDVQWLIERLEKLLSNFADTNDYHGSPKIAVQGKVEGFSKKGESGGILELSDGATAAYLAWEQAPESIKLEIENSLRMIFSLTQTPDISFDAVKGLGNAASGESLKTLFLDAHLKVMDKMEIFDDYLERRFNIIKEFIAKINTSFATETDEVELTPEVIPYMVNDVKNEIDNLVMAVTGGIMSKRSAVAKNPMVEDGAEEMKLIEAEQRAVDESANELDKIQNEEAA